MFNNLKADFKQRVKSVEQPVSLAVYLSIILSRSWLATCVYRFGRFAADSKIMPIKIILKIIYYPMFFVTQGVTGISIQAHCKIGPGMAILGTGGVFILAESIGSNFVVYSGVTVGNVRGSKNLANIGDNVVIEPGAKVLGEVNIGSDVVIRGNSLVITDIPENTMAIGNPARIKRKVQEGDK